MCHAHSGRSSLAFGLRWCHCSLDTYFGCPDASQKAFASCCVNASSGLLDFASDLWIGSSRGLGIVSMRKNTWASRGLGSCPKAVPFHTPSSHPSQRWRRIYIISMFKRILSCIVIVIILFVIVIYIFIYYLSSIHLYPSTHFAYSSSYLSTCLSIQLFVNTYASCTYRDRWSKTNSNRAMICMLAPERFRYIRKHQLAAGCKGRQAIVFWIFFGEGLYNLRFCWAFALCSGKSKACCTRQCMPDAHIYIHKYT